VPKVSDVMKVPFSGLAAVKGFATGNYADAIANAGLAVGQFGYAFGKYYIPSDKWKKEFGQEVYLLEIGIQLVTALTLLHGSGTDQGQFYELGSGKFELAWESLKDATVSEASWLGESADAYNARNAEQLDWATTMADLDTKIAAILAREAGDLKDAKLNLTYCRATFTVLIPVAVALRAYNPLASWIFQLTAFTTVMTAALMIVDVMRLSAGENASEIDAIAQQYRAVADSAVVTGSDSAASAVAPASKSAVGDFGTVNSVASPAATVPGMAAPVPVTGGSDGRAPAAAGAATFDDGDSSGEAAPPVTAQPQAVQAGAAPAYAGPAVSQGTTTRAASAASVGTPAGRHRASEKPTEREPFVADGVPAEEAVGAAAGGADGERAPIDAAAGPQAARQRRGEES